MYVEKSALADAGLLIVGDAMVDQYWFGDVDRISPEAPIPIVRVMREEHRLGGAANVALNARMLGTQASLLTAVGTDNASQILKKLLVDKDIAPLFLTDPAMMTTVKLRVVGRSQQLLRIDFENRPNDPLLASMKQAFSRILPDIKAVIFSDYGKGTLADVSSMINEARAAGKVVLVDPKGCEYAPYTGATVVTPNRAEFAQAAGQWRDETDFVARGHALRERLDLEALLVTRSEEGMSLFDKEGHFRVEAQVREVFDVTGAGDTVIATLAAMLAIGMPMREAVVTANRAAGLVVRKFGTATASYQELFECA